MTVPAYDPSRPPGVLKRAITNVALSKPGTWFYINVASRIDPPLARATGGRVTSAMGLLPIALLTAKGARSGNERTVPLVYFTDGDDVILMASSFGRPRHPAWYHNLKANPLCQVWSSGQGGAYTARETEGADRDRLYELAKNLYSGYGVYEERAKATRKVPVLRLSPA
jgi:deazaflavin-dependent oxidoreductase (nitroreductase family)